MAEASEPGRHRPPRDETLAAAEPDEARRRREMLGVAWICADILTVLATALLAKQAGITYPPAQIAFMRGAMGTLMLLPLAPELWRMRSRLGRPGMHLFRAVVGVVSLVANFAALAALPLGLYTAATFTRPLIVLAMAALFLKEVIGGRTWLAALAGFGGVLVAVWPKIAGGDPASVQGLMAAALNVVFGALSVIAVRLLSGEPRAAVMLGYTIGMVTLLGPWAWAVWEPVALRDWPLLISIGVVSQIGLFCFVSGQRLASAATLAPLGYLQLVLAPVAGYLVFDERPTRELVIGGSIILAAGLWNTLRR